jgi:uncharacterized membrane protein YeaQ/YmgE (transglycosylase-associated protein family)
MGKANRNKKVKNKRSGNFAGILIFLLIGGICGFLGGFLGSERGTFDGEPGMMLLNILGVLICVYIATFVQIIVHEGTHLICGKFSGYDFVSFRIGSLMLIKENGHIKRKKFSIVGTGGQCLMMPPECDVITSLMRCITLAEQLEILFLVCYALSFL